MKLTHQVILQAVEVKNCRNISQLVFLKKSCS